MRARLHPLKKPEGFLEYSRRQSARFWRATPPVDSAIKQPDPAQRGSHNVCAKDYARRMRRRALAASAQIVFSRLFRAVWFCGPADRRHRSQKNARFAAGYILQTFQIWLACHISRQYQVPRYLLALSRQVSGVSFQLSAVSRQLSASSFERYQRSAIGDEARVEDWELTADS